MDNKIKGKPKTLPTAKTKPDVPTKAEIDEARDLAKRAGVLELFEAEDVK